MDGVVVHGARVQLFHPFMMFHHVLNIGNSVKIIRTIVLDSPNMTRDSDVHGSTADIDPQVPGWE